MGTLENDVDVVAHKAREKKRQSRHTLEKNGGKEEDQVDMSERS